MGDKNQDFANKPIDGMVHSILDGVAIMNADLTIKSHVLDQIQAAVTVTDLDGNILYVNLVEKETLGYSNEDLIGASTQVLGENIKKGASQDEILAKTLRYGKWIGEVTNKTADGREVLTETRTQVIYNDQGDRVALAGVSVDITKRKELEKRIAAEKELFKTTLLSVCDGVISIDAKGKVLILNPIAEQLTGWTLKEALGRPIEEVFQIINEFEGEIGDNPIQMVFETGAVVELSWYVLTRRGIYH